MHIEKAKWAVGGRFLPPIALACGVGRAVGWPREFHDVVGGQEGDEAFLPAVVATFDFAFGLRGGSGAELDAAEVPGRAELGEGIGVVGVEEGVVVHRRGPAGGRALARCGTGSRNGPARFLRGRGGRRS